MADRGPEARPGAPWLRRRGWPLLAVAGALVLVGFLAGLWRPSGPAPPPGHRRLAVLPFESLGSAPEQEVLSDGLTEELINQLARRYGGRLGVIARSSVMRFKGSGKSAPEIARELESDWVLEGSVRRSEGRVRITAHLVRAADATELWAGAWERPVADLLAWQREVGRAVAGALAVPLEPEIGDGPTVPAAVSPQAYEAYLKGLYLLRRPEGGGGVQAALDQLEEAVRRDPGFAAAHAALAQARLRRGGLPLEMAPGAEAAARRALELDPGNADAHLTLALTHLYVHYDWRRAEEHFLAALAASPGHADARHHYAGYLSALGRHGEALAQVVEARRLDPLSVLVQGDAAWYLFFARRYGEAVAQARETLSLEPHHSQTHRLLLAALSAQGEETEALDHARSLAAATLPGGDTAGATGSFPDLGAFWRWQLAVLEEQSRRRHVPPSELALAHLALGETDRALALLADSCRQHCGLTMPFLAVDPRLDPVRSDPRFQELLDCIGLPVQAPARAAVLLPRQPAVQVQVGRDALHRREHVAGVIP